MYIDFADAKNLPGVTDPFPSKLRYQPLKCMAPPTIINEIQIHYIVSIVAISITT